jgi:uncharacterized repeat protein (TIGR03803 family)
MRPLRFPRFRKLDCRNQAYALLLLCAATAPPIAAQTFTTLFSFDGTDGADSSATLVQATNGNLYGATVEGGANGFGAIFKITPTGTLTTLYSFCSRSDCFSAYPGGLVQAANGNFYGTTIEGGAYGTVFEITPGGTLTTLYSLDFTDGVSPNAPLVQATNGDLYGTAINGGTSSEACPVGCGTVFKMTPSGTLTALHSFCSQSNCTDGAYPAAALVQATNGDLYGTTLEGGANNQGTVFKITPSGTLTTLYSFCSPSGCADGVSPFAPLVQATDGDLYGTTDYGGANGYGTVFKITPSGTLTTLYSFDGTVFTYPHALVQATDGNFYGTTQEGGTNDSGTVFKITPSGTLTTLYNFCSQSGCTDGAQPFAGLVQDTNGDLYGTTQIEGANNDGTVFRLSISLRPFVETNPTSGKVGAAVKILGTSLTGATSVTLNGTTATFTVASNTEIKTTVPAGATTGIVEVTTPTRTLKSNVVFRVP